MDHATLTPRPVKQAGLTMGEHVVTWRKLQQLTQKVVADRAGISTSTLRRVEQGDLGVSLETLLRVARALGRLESVEQCLNPLDSDLGRIRAIGDLPRRVRS